MGISMTPWTIALAILALGVLIIVHEGGHFLLARLSNMRVERFSIGFGPTLFSMKRGETTYQIAAIPFGGFVQIAGLNPGEEGISPDDPRAYPNRPVWQRLATIFAGPGTNYLFAAIVMIAFNFIWGVPVLGKGALVGVIADGKPAAAVGLQLGDEIVQIDGKPVGDTGDVKPLINAAKGGAVAVTIVRDGQKQVFNITPVKDGDEYRIGIEVWPKEETAKAPAGECIRTGLMFPISYSGYILHGFREIFAGRQKPQFSGPLGIVRVLQKQISQGAKASFSIIAIISVYLGLFNLLPLPALDGGRLVFLGWELISRRRVNQRVEQTVHMVGMFVLLGFILWVSIVNDMGVGKLLHK